MQGGGCEGVLPVLRAPDNAADAVPREQIQNTMKFLFALSLYDRRCCTGWPVEYENSPRCVNAEYSGEGRSRVVIGVSRSAIIIQVDYTSVV